VLARVPIVHWFPCQTSSVNQVAAIGGPSGHTLVFHAFGHNCGVGACRNPPLKVTDSHITSHRSLDSRWVLSGPYLHVPWVVRRLLYLWRMNGKTQSAALVKMARYRQEPPRVYD